MSHRNLIAYENQIIKYKSEIERLNLIHSTMPDLLWEINNRFAFSYISSNVKKILGYESHDMVGVSLFDFIDAKGKDEIINKFKQILLKDNETLFMKLIMIHKDGSKINFEMNGSPFYKKSGSILWYRGISRDVTNQIDVESILNATNEVEIKKFRRSFLNGSVRQVSHFKN